MKELFDFLEKHTSEKGEWKLSFNEYKGAYSNNPKEYYCGTFFEDELEEVKHVDWDKNIYELVWYKDTPVGSYTFIANTIEEIYKEVIKI